MTASQKPKTPSMTMKVRADVPEEDVLLFCKRASRVALSQVVEDVVVNEELKVEGDARRTRFVTSLNLYPVQECKEEYDLDTEDVLLTFSVKFPLCLKKEILIEMKKLDADLKAQMAQLGQGSKSRERQGGGGDDDEEAAEVPKRRRDDDEDSEVGDGDADDAKHARQRKQQATYDSDEEEEEIGEMDDAAIEAAYATDEEPEVDAESVKKSKSKSLHAMIAKVADSFSKSLSHAVSFEFSESKVTFVLEVSLILLGVDLMLTSGR